MLATSPHPPYSKTMCQEGLEPPTLGLEGRCSIQLSYWHTFGAGDGNRTHVAGLEGQNSTIELHPQHRKVSQKKKYRGGGIRTPGPMVPNHVLYQTEPHPVTLCLSDENYYISLFHVWQVFFSYFPKFFSFFSAGSVKRPQEAVFSILLLSLMEPGLIKVTSPGSYIAIWVWPYNT